MKKQSGFTLIELMVVMAIIAILATAGLSAYTGYIKKARDTTRIADISAINTIALGQLSVSGKPPQSGIEIYNAILAANNNQLLVDPLTKYPFTGTNGIRATGDFRSVCLDSGGLETEECNYTYRLCDGGTGYAIGTRFESASNKALYDSDEIGAAGTAATYADNEMYELGSCQTACTVALCPTIPAGLIDPVALTCTTVGASPYPCTAVTTAIGT